MIVTVTPAPAIDRTVAVGNFELGAVNRALASVEEPSGKGVNVSWALHRAGIPTRAIFPAGGRSGRFMSETLDRHGVDHVIVDTGHEVRTNITLVIPGQSGTKINEQGYELTGESVQRLFQAIEASMADATTVLTSGSLPPGMPPDFHRDVLIAANDHGLYSAVDTSGSALRMALDGRPSLVKPNVHELGELIGRGITTFGEVIAAAESARDLGAAAVLASLGADGTLLVDDSGVLYAHASHIPVVNAVGAGDALLAGFMVSQHAEREVRLRNAVLWASSAVAWDSTLFPVRADFASLISVTSQIDAGQPLIDPSNGPRP